MTLRYNDFTLLAKIESSEGVDAVTAAASDGLLAFDLSFGPEIEVIPTNESTGGLDSFGSVTGRSLGQASFSVYLKGSGAAGTAPEFGKLLRACGFAELITSSAVPSSAEACGAGGSTTAAELGASASGTAQAYLGMPLVLTGAQTGTALITNYTTGKIASLDRTFGAAIVPTTNYQVPINVRYLPASASIPSVTLDFYRGGTLRKLLGARGTVALAFTAGGVAQLNFTFTGRWSGETDVAVPAGVVVQSTRPQAWFDGAFMLNRLAVAGSSLAFDLGNAVAAHDDPNHASGYGVPTIRERNVTGTAVVNKALVATRNTLSLINAGTNLPISAVLGAGAGQRVGVVAPAARLTAAPLQDAAGIQQEGISFDATGLDSGLSLAFW